MATNAPTYEVDFYADDFIRDPHPHYAAMRELGPVVYIPSLGNYALTQHAVVQDALRDYARFSSAKGVAGDKFGSDFLQGNTVASDPPTHTKLRRAMAPPLLPGALDKIRPEVERVADTLIEGLVEQGSFDAIADLARYLPLKIVTEMVGLPDFGQDNMLKWAAAAFDVLGEQNQRGQNALDAIAEMRSFIQGQVTRETLKEGSWTYRILDLVDQGALSANLAPYAIRDYINPSLDTTISATGQLIWQLSQNPDQWEKLRDNPDLCRNAVNEAVRLGTPIRSFSRHTTQEVEVAGITLPQGARVMMLFASANRDALVFENPDQFDVSRDPKDHLGFGSGIHMCIGMHLAQLEMISLLKAMISRVGRIDVGAPEIALNNTIAAFATLPTTFQPDPRAPVHSDALTVQPSLLPAQVIERKIIAKDIVSLTLRSSNDTPLPVAKAGAHIDIYIRDGLVRQYSLTGQMSSTYEIAVQKESASRGGSIAIHENFQVGASIEISPPRNTFPLEADAAPSLLFSGGIGLTPIFAMAWELHAAQRPFEWHVSARSSDHLAYGEALKRLPFADNIYVHLDDTPATQPDISYYLKAASEQTHVYVCGPKGYMDFVKTSALTAGLDAQHIHIEHFGAEIDVDGDPFEIVAEQSGLTVEVGPTETILDALNRIGITVPTSCQNGVCGSCLTPVLNGTPDHRDLVLTDGEKASNDRIAVCCSRSKTKKLVLDL